MAPFEVTKDRLSCGRTQDGLLLGFGEPPEGCAHTKSGLLFFRFILPSQFIAACRLSPEVASLTANYIIPQIWLFVPLFIE